MFGKKNNIFRLDFRPRGLFINQCVGASRCFECTMTKTGNIAIHFSCSCFSLLLLYMYTEIYLPLWDSLTKGPTITGHYMYTLCLALCELYIQHLFWKNISSPETEHEGSDRSVMNVVGPTNLKSILLFPLATSLPEMYITK